MSGDINIESWMAELVRRMCDAFGERLALVGIQGSRARGEAYADSDIDIVVAVEELSPEDLIGYRAVISTMPHSDLACGFVGSPALLAAWPRHDVFNLVEDTRVAYGSFDFMDTSFTADDALLSAKVGAAEVYHAVSHEFVFAEGSLEAAVAACVKSAFFVMRALCFARTGKYPASRSAMRQLASPEERILLDAYDDPRGFDTIELARVLVTWSASLVETAA